MGNSVNIKDFSHIVKMCVKTIILSRVRRALCQIGSSYSGINGRKNLLLQGYSIHNTKIKGNMLR